jgi:hypothetical protein
MKSEALLNQFRDQINAVFCPKESSFYGRLGVTSHRSSPSGDYDRL